MALDFIVLEYGSGLHTKNIGSCQSKTCPLLYIDQVVLESKHPYRYLPPDLGGANFPSSSFVFGLLCFLGDVLLVCPFSWVGFHGRNRRISSMTKMTGMGAHGVPEYPSTIAAADALNNNSFCNLLPPLLSAGVGTSP